MSTSVSGWTTIAEDPIVLVREYGFGAGRANAMAVGLPGGKLLLVSPPSDVGEAELRELSRAGDVVALVANNGGHHLGLGVAHAAFPNAISYAAPDAAQRIRKKGKGFGQLLPIEALAPLLGDKVSVLAVDGCKVGDVIVRARTEKGALLFASDFVANLPKLPPNPIFRLVFWLTDSGPGFKVFGAFFKFFVKDRGAARDFLIRELEAHAHTILVPSHGDVIVRGDLAPTLISMLRAAV
jgi:hypothetical protein